MADPAIRPLAFSPHMNGVAWQAKACGILYQIWILHSGVYEVSDGTQRGDRVTFADAEALANEWHRARVRAEFAQDDGSCKG